MGAVGAVNAAVNAPQLLQTETLTNQHPTALCARPYYDYVSSVHHHEYADPVPAARDASHVSR